MEQNSFYYFFSTVAQVLAAISALLAIFTQFKINEITNFLIGDGIATFERLKIKETGYDILGKNHDYFLGRLRDSIGRKNIDGILEVITILAKEQIIYGNRDFKYLEKRFKERINLIKQIKLLTIISILFAFITIIISLIEILFVGVITVPSIYYLLIIITFLLTFTSMTLAFFGIYYGLKDIGDV